MALSDPADRAVKREVRFASGFGCVRCGCTIYQYRRIGGAPGTAPEADDLVLLCPPCIHALDGKAGAEAALRQMRQRPLALQSLFDRRRLPYLTDLTIPDVTIAPGVRMRNTVVPIMFGGIPVIKLGPPEAGGGAVDISIALGAADGVPDRIVRSNEWMASGDEWRFERPGNRYVFTSRDGVAKLILTVNAPNDLVIERLCTRAGNRMLEAGLGGVRVDGVKVMAPAVRSQLVGVAL